MCVRGHVCGLCVHYYMVYGSQIHADVKSEVANNRYFFIEHHILQIIFHHSNNFLHREELPLQKQSTKIMCILYQHGIGEKL